MLACFFWERDDPYFYEANGSGGMELPLVSEIITTYNHASYITQCFDSVVAYETRFPFEILLGENDPTEGTREIVRKYEQEFPERIQVFYRNQEDEIFVSGRKTGRNNFVETLKAAQGKYIANLDGDDFWTSP